jgi:ABC-type transport system involved in multi-copper enzyme maturation permease subunit
MKGMQEWRPKGETMAVPSKRQDAWLVFVALALWAVLAFVSDCPSWVVGILILSALLALQWEVARRGGWRLIGPHAYFDLIRMARKGRTVLFRVLFLLVLLGGIGFTYERERQIQGGGEPWWFFDEANQHDGFEFGGPWRQHIIDERPSLAEQRERLARFNSKCAYTWFLLQNVAILILAPAYVGGAIADERERGMLQLLFTSQLYNREIVMGKLVARLLHLGAFLLAGLPIFCIMQVWGGVDFVLLLGNWINSALLLLCVCSVCLAISALPISATVGVVTSYAVVLLPGVCSAATQEGAPLVLQHAHILPPGPITLKDPRWGIIGLYVAITTASLFWAMLTLRNRGSLTVSIEGESRPKRAEQLAGPALTTGPCSPFLPPLPLLMPLPSSAAPRETELQDSIVSPVPPVWDDAMLWKELCPGRRLVSVARPDRGMFTMAGMLACCFIFAHLLYTIGEIAKAEPDSYAAAARILTDCWGPGLRIVYVFALVWYFLGTAFRATASVVRERQMQTLDMLLLISIERSEILRAKWKGALFKGWPWLALLAADLAIGGAIGAYHPLGLLCLIVLPVPVILCACAVGILISTLVRTVLHTNLVMGVLLLGLVVGFGWTDHGRTIVWKSLAATWWYQPLLEVNELEAVGISSIALLVVAAVARRLATAVFERTGRA